MLGVLLVVLLSLPLVVLPFLLLVLRLSLLAVRHDALGSLGVLLAVLPYALLAGLVGLSLLLVEPTGAVPVGMPFAFAVRVVVPVAPVLIVVEPFFVPVGLHYALAGLRHC